MLWPRWSCWGRPSPAPPRWSWPWGQPGCAAADYQRRNCPMASPGAGRRRVRRGGLLRLPSRRAPQGVLAAAILGGIAVVLARSLTPLSADLSRPARTLPAAPVIGVVGQLLAHRSRAPAALWMVPAILPLLPPLDAAARARPDRTRPPGLAGPGRGDGRPHRGGRRLRLHPCWDLPAVRARVLQPVVGVVRPIRSWGRRWRRPAGPAPAAATPSAGAQVDPPRCTSGAASA
jgi:hypothetical protein